MSLRDFEIFIQERLTTYDESLDVTSGSALDTRVIQPILRRLGTDPFTVDAATFMLERLSQAFPDLATTDGDGVSDLLIKPLLLLWDPIIREIQRVKKSKSFRDALTLTTEEAEALGANLFAPRKTGELARGSARIYFASPQPIKITAGNFFTSRGGLHFFPTGAFSISADEMMLNSEGDLYYFDVDVIAETAGTAYNINADELATIANIDTAARVTNKTRFREGVDEDDVEDYIGNLDKSLTEKSLVTVRGIASRIGNTLPEVTRLGVVGFGDELMKRDILKGGSLGRIVGFGDVYVAPDGDNKFLSRRLYDSTADFITMLGPVGVVKGFVVTVIDAFGPSTSDKVRDLTITRVIDATRIEVEKQELYPASGTRKYIVRRRELVISGMPGGIVIQGENLQSTIPPDEVHIGGMADIFVRSNSLDTSTLVIDSLSDEEPLLSGKLAHVTNAGPDYFIELTDLVLGVNYQQDDDVWKYLNEASERQYTLHVMEGAVAGSYRVYHVVQALSSSPVMYVTPEPLGISSSIYFRWKLVTNITVNLVEPKDVRIASFDGQCLQGSDIFTTTSGTDLDVLGVSVGDTLRIHNGLNTGDYNVEEVVSPGFTTLILDRSMIATNVGVKFTIFRANSTGGVIRPLVRIASIDLLDTTGQPVGSTIPFAAPLEAVSSSFANAGNGVKKQVDGATLGMVSLPEPPGGFVFSGTNALVITWDNLISPVVVSLSGTMTVAQIETAINAVTMGNPLIGVPIARSIEYGTDVFLGIIPPGKNTRLEPPTGSVLVVLFGSNESRSCTEVRGAVDWSLVTPSIDVDLDALVVVDGVSAGSYSDLRVGVSDTGMSASSGLRCSYDFAPEVNRVVHVGSRSLGTARLYFLDPTSVEVDVNTRFSVETETGTVLYFKPDPTLEHQLFPAKPNGVKHADGATTAAVAIITTTTDFTTKGIREGDLLVVDYVPIYSAAMVDPVLGIALKDLRISYDGGPDKIITFINDVTTAGAVSRDGVVEQINTAIGEEICEVVEVSPAVYNIKFNPKKSLKIRKQSPSPSSSNGLFGFSDVLDTSNASPNAGTYTIINIGGLQLTVDTPFTVTSTEQQYYIKRRGMQRISTTEMVNNTAPASLYYFDVELVSEGAGDTWNISQGLDLLWTGLRSDGYYLTTSNDTTSFSTAEDLQIHFSKSILDNGVDDDPDNSIQLTNQQVGINYEYGQVVDSTQGFISSETERVVNANLLARHLLPVFVRFDAVYKGGVSAMELTPVLEKLIREVLPDQALDSFSVQRKLAERGAFAVTNPIELVGIKHGFDRKVSIIRSTNELLVPELSAFISNVLNLTRATG